MPAGKHIVRADELSGTCREVFGVATPLILMTGSMSLLMFTDGLFLAHYSLESISAVIPAGVMAFNFFCLFIGITSYVNTFIAQYYGSNRHDEIGRCVWQGVFIALLSTVVIWPAQFFAEDIFALAGHAKEIRAEEAAYFRIVVCGAFFAIARTAFGSFYVGRGENWVVMRVNVLSVAINIVLDYALIFGKWGLPEMGIVGAATGTVSSNVICTIVYTLMFTRRRHVTVYRTDRWRPDWKLIRRILYFGFPSGFQFLVNVSSFSFFIQILGSIGRIEQACGSIVFNVNRLAFMPMIGMEIAMSTLVGKYIGMRRSDLAQKTAVRGFLMTLTYMGLVGLIYFLFPGQLFELFRAKGAADFDLIKETGAFIFRLMAVYCLFDACSIVFQGIIKGAGDTQFVLRVSIIVSLLFMILPTALARRYAAPLWVFWAIFITWVGVFGAVYGLRFLGGKWKSMQVIDDAPPVADELAPPHDLV